MPESAKAPSGGSSGLKKRIGPLSVGGWAASLGGALVLYILLRRYEASKAASSAAAGGGTGADVLTAGGTVPTSLSQTGTTGGAPFSSYAGWLTAALAQMTSSSGLDAGTALNAINDWLNGQCVSQQGYTAITSAIASESIGLPPGWGTNLPNLTVCTQGTGSAGGTTGGGTSTGSTPAPSTVHGPHKQDDAKR